MKAYCYKKFKVYEQSEQLKLLNWSGRGSKGNQQSPKFKYAYKVAIRISYINFDTHDT